MTKPYYCSEQRCVEDFAAYGAKRVPCSGALPHEKLDVSLTEGKLDNYRLSNKHTFKPKFSVDLEDWDKDKSQARFMGCKLMRRIELEDPNTGKLRKFIVHEQDDYLEVID